MREKIVDLQRHVAAGPTHYRLPPTLGFKGHDVTKERAPAYTLRNRTPLMKETLGPGPAYGLRPNLTRQGRGDPPAYTLRRRQALQLPVDIPGPGSYRPEKCTNASRQRAPSFSLGNRTCTKLLDNLPGPAAYRTPPGVGKRAPHKLTAPAYTMRGWLTEPYSARGPGPAAYLPPPPDKYRERRAPQPEVTGRRPPPPESARPVPDAYYHKYPWGRTTPGCTFGIRNSPLVVAFFLREDNP